MKKDYDSTRIYRNTQKKGASQTYDTPSFLFYLLNENFLDVAIAIYHDIHALGRRGYSRFVERIAGDSLLNMEIDFLEPGTGVEAGTFLVDARQVAMT